MAFGITEEAAIRTAGAKARNQKDKPNAALKRRSTSKPALSAAWLAIVGLLAVPASAQRPQVPPASQQIDAAVLPLPAVMRDHAAVLGYAADRSVVMLRQGSNGMVCTATRPGDDEFDVRCYHESFMPVVRRLRELHSQGAKQEEIYRTIDAEVKAKKLAIPDHPTAGYRMLGPISAYHAESNTIGSEIKSWQSVHFPYKTAAEIGLPEEGQVATTMPYVMASGTFWSHVMIEHEDPPSH